MSHYMQHVKLFFETGELRSLLIKRGSDGQRCPGRWTVCPGKAHGQLQGELTVATTAVSVCRSGWVRGPSKPGRRGHFSIPARSRWAI